MSLISWNCRGLGNAKTMQGFSDLTYSHRPDIFFLMETKLCSLRAKDVLYKHGYSNFAGADSAGSNGGLALGWNDDVNLQVTQVNNNYIDCLIKLSESDPGWRLTCYYAFPDASRRREAWNVLRSLAEDNNLPWVIIGDFNDIMYDSEKNGRVEHPLWRTRGFWEAVTESGLRDFPFEGYQWTWDRGKNTNYWVEEKLDRILVNDDWWNSFMAAQASSIEAPTSDHMALRLKFSLTFQNGTTKRFRFENIWLREEECRAIVTNSWNAGDHLTVSERINFCGRELLKWDTRRPKGFRRQILACKKRLAWLRGKGDASSLAEFSRVRLVTQDLMEKEHIYWNQWAKEFWLKEGDINSRFFHNAVKQRRRKNKLLGLRAADGSWVTDREKVREMVGDYFTLLFQQQGTVVNSADLCPMRQITDRQNELLI
ncbi:unnamed protein product [Cuscuta epithymum]|uniref:Endonuclease/exonuclease/phosphatase domain-containing protein n=1 Tax=Cuscuta epithymum TaxID=186058 RepID=A0AAV0D012_9ASTE|nr:unnamed protein product [Cuscuta epithymum]